MSCVNQHMERDTLVSEFATVFYGVFSALERKLSYVNAGHDPPLLLRDGRFRELDVGGMVVGVLADAGFDEETIELRCGDVLVFYTDGVIDALDFQGERFGRDRLRESILKYHDAQPAIPEPSDQFENLLRLADPQRRRRLVHKNDPSTPTCCASDCNRLTLASRQMRYDRVHRG